MPSRRVLLRSFGTSLLAFVAGCSGTDESTPEPTTTAEYQETTIMSPVPTTTAATAIPTDETSTKTTDGTGTTTPTESEATPEKTSVEDTTSTTMTEDGDSESGGANYGGGGPSGGGNSGNDSKTTSDSDTRTTTESTPTETTTERPSATTTDTDTTATTAETSTTTTAETTTEPPTATTTPATTTPATTTPATTTTRTPDGTGSWSVAADLPASQSNAGGGVVDGSLYFFGGIESGENLPAVARTYRFNPADGTWTRLEDLPRSLWAPCGVAAEGKLFSFGGAPTDAPYGTGEPPSDEIFVYTPGEGWRDLTAETGVRCPYPNWAMSGVYNRADGRIYLVGGGTNVTDRSSASDHGVGTDDPGTYDESRVWTFDPVAEEVVNPDLTRLPEARRWPTVAIVEVDGETCLHSVCGLFGVTGPTDDNLRYRIAADEWESMTPAPRAGMYATTSDPVVDGTMYLTHGFFWEDEPSVDAYAAVCHAYDPTSDDFRTDLASPERLRGGAVDAVVDGTLYVVGGHVKRYDRNGFHDCKTANEAFTPPN